MIINKQILMPFRLLRGLVAMLMVLMGTVAQAETVTVSLAPSTNGTFSNSASISGYYTTWISNATSGMAGLTITTGGNLAMCQQNVSSYGGNLLALKTTSSSTPENLILTAPTGYLITGYTLTAKLYSSTADGYKLYNSTGAFYTVNTSGKTSTESGLSTSSVTLQIEDTKGTSTNYLCVTSLTVTLEEIQVLPSINLTFSRADDGNGNATANVSGVTVTVKDFFGTSTVSNVTATLESTSCLTLQSSALGSSATNAIKRTSNAVLAPATGYDNTKGAAITYTFKVEGLPLGFVFDKSIVDVYALTSGGGSQTYNDSRVWDILVETSSNGSTWTTFTSASSVDITSVNNVDGGVVHNPWQFSGSQATGSDPLYVKVTLTRQSDKGCFAGISNLKLFNSSAVSWPPTASEVYTINNTNSGRGALMYAPSQSTDHVWSSGKNSQTFDASNANCQWAFIPTGTDGQYYLYNVGADKFAIPSGVTNGADCPWLFSNSAVPVTLTLQSDGTFKIKAASGRVNDGTNNAIVSVSNGQTYPIINYDDAGSLFTITKVKGDASTAANATVAKLVRNQTALTTYPSTSGWYVLQIKSASSNTASVGRYVYGASSLYNDLYPLTYTGSIDLQPSVTDPTFFTHLDCRNWDDNDWQLPDGRYLVANSNNKFPTVSTEASSIIAGYDGGNYFKSSANYFADSYNSNGNYYIGETTSFRTKWNVYPIDLTEAGLTPWQILCNNAPETAKITCNRSDVSGLTSVYKNGYIFLPTGVTPTSSDFVLAGSTDITVDATAHTVTIAYDPNLAIVDGGVTVAQGYQVTGRGNDKAVLLRITAAPFKEMTNTSLTISLDETTVNNISVLTLYEATSNGVEFMAMGDLTQAATTTTIGTSTSLNLGTVAAGTHYYWLCATVKSDATLGAILDAAVSDITYTCNSNETTLPLNLNPSARGLMVFNKEQTLFVPTTGGSNYYRIPALITANDGSLIAACDKRYNSSSDLGNHKIDVVLRRSTNGGATWSAVALVAEGDGTSDAAYGYGDPVFVKCASGKIICLMAAGKTGFWSGMSNIAMITSNDNGETWSSPIDITTNTGHFTNNSSKSDWFVTSGKGLCTHDGVVMFLLDADHSAETNLVLYSVDEGENWIIDDAVVATGANEAKLVELSDGNLLSSTRNGGNRIFNTGTYTKNTNDCDFTWGTQTTNSTLNQGGSGNNQDIIVYERNNDNSAKILLHTLTVGNGHKNLKLFISIDQGTTWSEMMQIQPEGSRYAVMTILDNGDVGILFEDNALNAGKEYPITFLTITQQQIHDFYAEMTEAPVTFHIKSADGSTTYFEATKTVYGNTSDLPTDLKRAFCTYTMYSDAAMTQQIQKVGANTDVYVKCIYGGPFDFSTTDNPKWYFMYAHKQNDTSDYLAYVNGTTYGMKTETFFNKYSDTKYHWAFIGNPYSVQVLNRSNNGYLSLSTDIGSASNNSALTNYTAVSSNATAYPYNTFSLYGFSNSNVVTTDPFHLCLNDHAGVFVNGYNGNIYYHSSVVPNTDLQVTNWKDGHVMVLEVPTSYPVTLNTVGAASYATLYLPFDVTTDANTKAYYIGSTTNGYAQLTELADGEIAANTAVLLVNEAASSAIFSVTTGLSQQVSESANHLKGTLSSMELDLSDGTNFYALGAVGGNIGFYKFDDGNGKTSITLGANKAYLDTTAPANAVKGFVFDLDEDPDAIHEINGQWSMDNGQSIYNLAGQRLNKPVKGVNIINGKKVLK